MATVTNYDNCAHGLLVAALSVRMRENPPDNTPSSALYLVCRHVQIKGPETRPTQLTDSLLLWGGQIDQLVKAMGC